MLKEERLASLLKLIDQKGVIKVNEIIERMAVSDMTVRRDLTELEEQGKIKRIHGGAQSLNMYKKEELSHEEKQIIHQEEKLEIVQKALSLIQEEDTLFLGPGTTIELLASELQFSNLRILTNSLPVFTILQQKHPHYQVYLIGGEYRKRTGAFFGDIANKVISDIRFAKAFVGANAIKENRVMTATIEEGTTQKIALDNSFERYLLIDTSKINKEDFYSFYSLNDMDGIILNEDETIVYESLEKEVRMI